MSRGVCDGGLDKRDIVPVRHDCGMVCREHDLGRGRASGWRRGLGGSPNRLPLVPEVFHAPKLVHDSRSVADLGPRLVGLAQIVNPGPHEFASQAGIGGHTGPSDGFSAKLGQQAGLRVHLNHSLEASRKVVVVAPDVKEIARLCPRIIADRGRAL